MERLIYDERDAVVIIMSHHCVIEPTFPEEHRGVFLSLGPKKTFGKKSVEVGSKKVR